MSFTPVSVDNKRMKKLQKKATKGEVHTFESYRECVALKIYSKPELYMVPDKTRLHAKHDLNISEVRELLISLFSDDFNSVPKYFSLKNKGFIRNVLLLHISDCENPIETLKALGTRTPSSVKISRQDYELNSFPEKLLTVSNNEGMFLIEEEERKNKKNASLNTENKDVENKLKNERVNFKNEYSLKDCVLSQSTMVMWGYPTPPPSTTSFSTSSTSTTSFTNTTSLPSFSTSNSTLPISISSSSLSTSFTTVSLNSESVSKEISLLSPPSLPPSTSSSLGNVPNSVEKRIREEDSSVSYDDVVFKKMRKECSLGYLEEGSQGTFLGGSNEGEKEIKEGLQKLEAISEESFSRANNDSNDKSEKKNGEEKGKEVMENEDVGVAIVLNNKGVGTGTVTDTGTEEKDDEQENSNNSNNSSDISDEPAVGSRVGSVPTEMEAREIFSLKRVDSEHKNNLNVCNKKNGNDDDDGNDSVKQRDGDGDDVIPSMLVFPAYTVSMQMTRGGPNTGPGVSAFRSTVSKTSRDFNSLWTASSSSGCTAIAPLITAAVDCEMCETAQGLELTRLTVIDNDHAVVLDTLVKPKNRITNYLTKYSGMTEELLQSVTVTLEQAQIAFMRLIPKETILIGHSLDSDLKALHMTHTQCVDTAILFPHPRGFPYRIKLKELAETYLNITIQRNHSNFTPKIVQDKDVEKDRSKEKIDNNINATTNKNDDDENNNKNVNKTDANNDGSANNSKNINKNKNENRVLVPLGHDSIEDASTAMRLVYLKLEKGPDFGSKIPLFGRIPLARFITGSGIIQNNTSNNVKNNNSDIDNQNLGRENENKNRENNSENSKIPPNPLITFFWENNVECKTMNSCICEDTVYNPPNALEENLINLREVFSFQEKKRISEDTVEITENNNLLRNQILCYFGIKSPNFSTQLTTINEENKDKSKNMDDMVQKRKNENLTNAEKMTKKIEYLKEILEKVKGVLKETKQGCLIIIAAQPPMSIVSNLLKQKSACENPQTVSRWSKELDLQLKEAYSTCNIAHIITTTL